MNRFAPRLLRRSALAGLIVAVIANGSPARAQDAPFTDAQKSAIEDMVRDYILQNPEVVLESLRIMEERQRMAEEERLKLKLQQLKPALYQDPRDPSLGNPDGDVVLVEFFDYQCGYCKTMLQTLVDFAETDGKVKVVMKEFPILGPESLTAAKASLAAHKQGKYEAFHVAMMTLRGKLTEPAIFQTALEVGLDIDLLKADMESKGVLEHIRETRALAQELEIRGTPAFTIGDRLIPGAFGAAQLFELVSEARERG